jgi:hypothetical protein
MKQITIAVPDDKFDFTVNLIKNLRFVKQVKTNVTSKEKFLNDLEDAVEEVNQIKAGKKKGILLKDFLNDL